jgi:hypothetical protein
MMVIFLFALDSDCLARSRPLPSRGEAVDNIGAAHSKTTGGFGAT